MTPERLGRFELLELVGAGGMGSVYRARERGSGAIVALKILHALPPSLLDEAWPRFGREVAALGRLGHERIVALRSGLERDGVRSFYAMEYVEGRSLAEILRARGRLLPREAAAAGVLMLDALAAAHDAGLVHRDVKPGNILIGRGGALKVADFGLARSLDTVGLTGTGFAPGTPAFMSPEQAEGMPADARSDLYAAGAVLYALLAGRPPFEAESALAVLRMHVTRSPPSLEERAPGTPRALATVIEHALEKEPVARYQSATAMREALLATGLVSSDADAIAALAALDPGAHATPPLPTEVRVAIAAPAPSTGARRRRTRWLAALAIVLLAAVAFAVATRDRRAGGRPADSATVGRGVADPADPGDPVVVRTRAGASIEGRLLRFDAGGAEVAGPDGAHRTVATGEILEIRRRAAVSAGAERP